MINTIILQTVRSLGPSTALYVSTGGTSTAKARSYKLSSFKKAPKVITLDNSTNLK